MSNHKNVLIITDSSADLTKEFCEERDVKVLPFAININNREYLDGVDINTEELFGYVDKTKKLPKTAARSVEDMKELIKLHRTDNQEVIWVSISSKLSANGQNSKTALQEMGGEEQGFFHIDSKGVSGALMLLIKKACDLRDDGKKAAEIATIIRENSDRLQISFVVETLEYLHKGGRCSGVQSFLGGLLKIRPSIKLVDGAMTVGKKYKGNFEKVVASYIEDTLSLNPDYEQDTVIVTHCFTSDNITKAVKEILTTKTSFKNIIFTITGSTIATHCGRGTLGMLYINKNKTETTNTPKNED